MTAQIIPFDFEDQAVRVIMRDDDPWFVAADVCRVLGVANNRDAIARLDEDEKGVGKTDTPGGAQQMVVISESGLYALVLRSNGATTPGTVQHRFRKWVTAEVLPSIRRAGTYTAPAAEPAPSGLDDMPDRETGLWLTLVREARLLGGRDAGRRMWARSSLPPLDARAMTGRLDGRACLRHVMGFELDEGTIDRLLLSPVKSAFRLLGGLGLRPQPGNRLFVANQPHSALFHGSEWSAGRHRAALLSIPGAVVHHNPLTLNGVRGRGVIVPLAQVEERVA
ncbi:MAG: BRO-N domain-containing protein [Paracoccus sp. (in: a-proteobacteria)]|uniref:BRO-N domain-containing protein n=1 Tax=Paracoccus sp. TaxID=267 RepID=UPI0040588F4C